MEFLSWRPYSSDTPVGLSNVCLPTVLSTSEQIVSQSLSCSHSKDLGVFSHSASLKYSKPEGGSSVVWHVCVCACPCMSVCVAYGLDSNASYLLFCRLPQLVNYLAR